MNNACETALTWPQAFQNSVIAVCCVVALIVVLKLFKWMME